MATYRYECEACGEFEIEQRMSDDALSVCQCGKPVKRLIPLSLGLHVPAWMSATRSQASEKQAIYLQSEEHKKNAAAAEKLTDRMQRGQDKRKTLRQDLERIIDKNLQAAGKKL